MTNVSQKTQLSDKHLIIHALSDMLLIQVKEGLLVH
jgi:hypothetical protein